MKRKFKLSKKAKIFVLCLFCVAIVFLGCNIIQNQHFEVNEITIKALKGEKLTSSEVAKYRGHIIVFLGREYHRLGWVQQYHIKALRNNSSRMMRLVGPDTGFDCINDGNIAPSLSRILDALDSTGQLPKTILYSLNPSDNELLATLAFCFTESGVPGKMQLGSAWWFLDQKDGMEKQIKALCNLGLLSRFVGMLTDSRSFLSYTRHEYFRRILCNLIGEWVENGEYPADMDTLGKMVDSGMLGPYTPLLRIVCDKHEADPNEDRLFCGANAMVLVLTENPMNGGLAATSVELMAQSLGVGVLYSGFLMGAINRTQEIKDRLNIKENQHLAAVMLMGMPDVKYQRTAPRKKANIIWE